MPTRLTRYQTRLAGDRERQARHRDRVQDANAPTLALLNTGIAPA